VGLDSRDVKRAAVGRWRDILTSVGGFDPAVLDGRHHPCPRCGGTDRFRLVDEAAGAVLCNKCFSERNGDGLAALMWANNWTFPEALHRTAAYLGINGRANGKVPRRDPLERLAIEKRVHADSLRAYGATVDGGKVVVPMFGGDGHQCSSFAMTPGGGKGLCAKGEPAGLFLPVVDGIAQLPRAGETWLVVEGVKKAAALHALGYLAVGLPTKEMNAKFARLFVGVDIIIVPDRDEAGEKGAQKTASRLRSGAANVRVATLPAEFTASNGADVRDVLHKADGERLLRQAIADAVEWKPAKNAKTAADSAVIRNFREIPKNDGKGMVPVPLSMSKVIEQVNLATDNGIRRVGRALFVHDTIAKPGQCAVDWLSTPASLFGFLRSRATVAWRSGDSFVGREEFHAELFRTAPNHIGVEVLPHEPKLTGHYYAYGDVEPGDGSALANVLDRFSPELPIDRDLIQAAFMTLYWGGLGGTRPVFVVTSADGRGAGKSKTVAMIVLAAGGAMDFGPKDEFGEVKTRFLSEDGLLKRAAVLENVKSLKFSWAQLEGLITNPIISGKKMYVGEATRPNTLTWFITLNGASLSTDMAQRAIIIRVKRPTRSGTWEEDTTRFIVENRPAIIADIIATLRADRVPLIKFSRWGSWERDVLSRLPDPTEAQQVIAERQEAVDVEEEEAALVEDFFADRLRRLKYDPEREIVHVPVAVAADWYQVATNTKHSVTGVSRMLAQMAEETKLRRLRPNPSKANGRGYLWSGEYTDIHATARYDLTERITKAKDES
jgi:phage/plasmid primase-like uncharacterized protein